MPPWGDRRGLVRVRGDVPDVPQPARGECHRLVIRMSRPADSRLRRRSIRLPEGSRALSGGGAGARRGQPVFVGEDHGLDAVADLELGEDPLGVRLDGGLFDDERGGDLGV
jgi:hypothetical protein